MSVYRPRDKAGRLSPIYVFDFRLGGDRFHGSTGATSRGEARAVERERKEQVRAEQRDLAKRRAAPMTIDVAADRFWQETGQHYRGGGGVTFESSLAWIVTELGKATRLRDITNDRIAELVARRRSEGVKPATVNRTVTEPLRRVLRRAEAAWDQAVAPIDWRKHRLTEPRERVRELSVDEEERLLASLPADFRVVVAFAIITGFRLAECIGLRWSDIDFGGRRISVRGKGDKAASIPLTPAVRELIWRLRGHHPEFVFTYAVRRPGGRGERRIGERLPITYEGMKTAWRRAKRGVPDFRFHDTRHTAATRMLRATGNLKLVQKLLRHDDIGTTAKYAHADDDDLRAAMEAVECQEKRRDGPSAETTLPAKSVT